MIIYISLLLPINFLLSINSPPSSPRRRSNSEVRSPPPLPLKRHSYYINPENKLIVVPSRGRHRVKSYYISGRQLFECDDKLFPSFKSASEYCLLANSFEESDFKQNRHRPKSSNSFRGKHLSRSNTNIHYGKKIISRSRNSLSGSSRSLSRQSLTDSRNHLSLRRDSVFESNTDLLSDRNSISGSRNSLSGRRSSLSRSRESLNGNVIDNKKNEESLDKYKKKKPQSHLIWQRVWNDCNIHCLSANHYNMLKQRSLLEMNMYRLHHKAKILEMSTPLSHIAQVLAEKYAIKQELDINSYPDYGILYCKSRIASASSIVKQFYETNAKYNYVLNRASSKAAYSFAQIVWRSTEELGVGVKEDNGYLYVVYIFFPKGNKKGKYKKNVHRWIKHFNKD
uniref:CAP domain-containing protein (inferred by orthology to a zebrafish protein) n=1 Tax=Strongyloides venezuelensis TaxID=75913 RepID=A0A0K0FD10_STRVS